MQAQRPGVWALLNKWLDARRARAERLALLEAQDKARIEAETRAEEKTAAEQDDVGAGDLLRVVSDVAWRILLVGVVAGLLVYAVIHLSVITLPAILAVFITALLMPLANWLRGKGLGRGSSTAISILVALIVLSGVITMIVSPAIQGFEGLVASVSSAITELQGLQIPFLDPALITEMIDNAWLQIQGMITDNTDRLLSGAWTAGAAVVQILLGLVLIIALTVYFVHSGDKLMEWIATLLPPKSRPGLHHAGGIAYGVMGRYVRGVAMVGFIDAVGIGIFLLIFLDINLAIPLIVLTFVGAFLPIIGAFLTGLLAALVAFVTEGWVIALVIVGAVVLVQQLESNIFAPRIYGQALELPSPVVLIAITAGGILGGIPGMFLATPVAAVLAALLRNRPPAHNEHTDESEGEVDEKRRRALTTAESAVVVVARPEETGEAATAKEPPKKGDKDAPGE
ncbi:AI-2E family transporter [Nocardiopsis alba]|uniref:AI-2E family transporter n=1 Tax=Nocardiopsis alba TaxID=53437 RepID=A0A7K2ILR6_9ACTN|nr:AI-2E family transporter [Nocardiopsis sp. LDBS1602]MEC3894433.1 AI-2E family transporter [Nocardiopsis sp. LDBS1602]MYR30918.1 AI-2E family transporter [Nocardiopsis alba]